MMRHSVAWYEKTISEIPGIIHIGVQKPKPGCVEIYVAISEGSNDGQVINEFLEYIDTPELDFMDLRVYFLKPVKAIDVGHNCIR
jgi:hypothetical protein